ncbi:MAG: hypothetical protein IKR81_05135 [Victivallales bacterium]|nr:hypothetical protein [Victivallales bacterium]
MNFVIFSYNFIPQNNPEAFCTARFANALAEAGHSVHVVTIDHPQQIPPDLEKELAPAVTQVTRVKTRPLAKSLYARLKYQTPEWDSINYDECIRTLKSVLKQTDSPILVTRMCPAASGIIGWHCRKDARLWVNHFSDPYPNYLKGGFLGRIVNKFTYRWTRRFLTDSAFCTVTCPDVIRFFQERVMPVEESRFTLVPHIGEPLITPAKEWRSPCPEKPYIAHAGNCYDGRYASELVRELLLCKQAGLDIAFVQAGDMLERDVEIMQQGGIDFRKLTLNSPREASSIFLDAAINLVIDLKIDYGGYTPFIPSKFVYLLYTDKPIIVFARKDSWMYRLVQENPNAGIFFADVNTSGQLGEICKKLAYQSFNSSVNRKSIRDFFSKQHAVEAFLAMCESYYKPHKNNLGKP